MNHQDIGKPKTREDFILFRGIYYGGSGASFLALLQLSNMPWSPVYLLAFTFLAASSIGFLCVGAMYEVIAVSFSYINESKRHFYRKYENYIVYIALAEGIVGGLSLMQKVLWPGASNLFTLRQNYIISAAFIIPFVSLVAIALIYIKFRNRLKILLH